MTGCRHRRSVEPIGPCEANALPETSACLAHSSEDVLARFLAAAQQRPGLLAGLLRDLEITTGLLIQLLPIACRLPDVRFDGSVFTQDFVVDAIFEGEVSFTECRFEGAVYFNQSHFAKIAYFIHAVFEQSATFGARFDDEARFDMATFRRPAFLGRCGAKAWFDRAAFDDVLVLSVASGDVVRFDTAQLSSLIVNGEQQAADSAVPPALLVFREATFSGTPSLRARGDIDVAFPGMTLTAPLTISALSGGIRILSLRNAVLSAPMVIGNGVDLGSCRMLRADGLGSLHFTSDPRWRTYGGRKVVADELDLRGAASELPAAPDDSSGEGIRSPGPVPMQVENAYRQLRVAQEAAKASHAAADFYYGEMEMRRIGMPIRSGERLLLATYRLVAGYGVRAGRALAGYLAIIFSAGLLLRFSTTAWVADQAKVLDSSGLSFDSYVDCVTVALRYSVSFLSGSLGGLTGAGTVLVFVLRLAGPAAFALILLALRARVQR
jgi:hypothetical protein